MKKRIISFIILLMMLLIPVGVYADIGDPSVTDDSFIYDGTEKSLVLSDYPEGLDPGEIGWTLNTSEGVTSASGESINIGCNVISGTYSVVYGTYGSILGRNFQITPRTLIIKPKDVTAEFSGQTIKASEYILTNGDLVTGHKLNITYGGSNNSLGEKQSSILSYEIMDAGSNIVTANYNVTLQPGKLVLTKPFEVIVDPEPEGRLAGPSTANPRTSPGVANPTSNSNAGNNTNTNENTGSENPADEVTTKIEDGDVPLDSGDIITIPDDRTPLANEANNALAIALFCAVFMIISIIVIYLVARRRNKSRNGSY